MLLEGKQIVLWQGKKYKEGSFSKKSSSTSIQKKVSGIQCLRKWAKLEAKQN